MALDLAVIIAPGEPSDILLAYPGLEGASDTKLIEAMHVGGAKLLIEGVVESNCGSLKLGIFGCPVLATELTGVRALRDAQRELAKTVELATKSGANYIALAGANAVLGEMRAPNSKKRLAEVLSERLGIWISTGYRLGTWAIGAQLVALARELEIKLACNTVGIVGGGGRFAHKLAITLPTLGIENLLLQDISVNKLDAVAQIARDHGIYVETTLDLTDVLTSSAMVVFVPSTRRPIVDTWEIPSGSVHICDTYPRVHHTDVFERKDIVATQVVLHWPNLTLQINEKQRLILDVADNHSIWPCAIEAGLAAVQGFEQNLLDPGTGPERVNGTVHQIGVWAVQLGVRVAPFQVFGQIISKEQLEFVAWLHSSKTDRQPVSLPVLKEVDLVKDTILS